MHDLDMVIRSVICFHLNKLSHLPLCGFNEFHNEEDQLTGLSACLAVSPQSIIQPSQSRINIILLHPLQPPLPADHQHPHPGYPLS